MNGGHAQGFKKLEERKEAKERRRMSDVLMVMIDLEFKEGRSPVLIPVI